MTLPWNSVATAVGGERSCRPGWLLSPPRRRSQRCRRWQVFQLGTWGPNNKVGSFREIYSNCYHHLLFAAEIGKPVAAPRSSRGCLRSSRRRGLVGG